MKKLIFILLLGATAFGQSGANAVLSASNGLSDDIASINAVANSAANVHLTLQAGTYLISAPIAKNGGTLIIEGKNVVIKLSPTFAAGQSVTYGAFDLENLASGSISGITIDGNRTNLASKGNSWTNYIMGISLYRCNNFEISNCNIINAPSGPYAVQSCNNIYIHDSKASDFWGNGITFQNSTYCTAERNRIIGPGNEGDVAPSGVGILGTGSNFIKILHNHIDSTSDTGTKTEGCNDVTWDGNYVGHSSKDGIKFENLHDNAIGQPKIDTVYNGKIINNTVDKIWAGKYDGSCLIQSFGAQDVVIANNIIIGGAKTGEEDGIQVDQNSALSNVISKNINISNNILRNCNRFMYLNYADNVTVTGNQTDASMLPLTTKDRVYISSVSNLLFHDNTVKGFSTAAANGRSLFMSGCSDFNVHDNKFINAAHGFYLTSKTSRDIRFTNNTFSNIGQYAGTFDFFSKTTIGNLDLSNNSFINFSQVSGLGFAALRIVTNNLTANRLDASKNYFYTSSGVNRDQVFTIAGTGTIEKTDIREVYWGTSGGGALYEPSYKVSGKLIK